MLHDGDNEKSILSYKPRLYDVVEHTQAIKQAIKIIPFHE